MPIATPEWHTTATDMSAAATASRLRPVSSELTHRMAARPRAMAPNQPTCMRSRVASPGVTR